MIQLIIYLLLSYGLTKLITDSVILNSIRKLIDKLNNKTLSEGIRCGQCSGFYIGMLITFLLPYTSSYLILDILFYEKAM